MYNDIDPIQFIKQEKTKMKMIKPSEISGRILSLLEESDEKVILISPYIRIAKWYKLLGRLNELKFRGVLLYIYVRDDPDNSATYHDLDQLNLPYKRIPYLHSKLYMNERSGIVTSMNLLLSSEINALEIGYATENWEDYNDLFEYYERNIRIRKAGYMITDSGRPASVLKGIMQGLREDLHKGGINSWFWLSEDTLHISTGLNNYSILITGGYLRITASVRIPAAAKKHSEEATIIMAKKVRDLCAMNTEMYPGQMPDTFLLSGQSLNKFKSTCIPGILDTETTRVMESIKGFIMATGYSPI